MRAELGELGTELVIGGYSVLSTSRESLADHLLTVIATHRRTALFFANTNFVVKNRFLLERQPSIRTLTVNDGVGMDVASLLLHHARFAHNLNGTDFVPYLFEHSESRLRVYLLGGTPEVLARAVAHVESVLGQSVVGSSNGYDDTADATGLVERIAAADPQVVLVAMGNPLQERWILDNADRLDANVYIGVGALFDFWAGDKARAPRLLRALHLEWLYRLWLEPRRLLRRYTLDIVVFLRSCYRYR